MAGTSNLAIEAVVTRDIEFDQSDGVSFENFAAGLLWYHSPSYRVGSFFLTLTSVEVSQYELVNRCLQDALKRGVKVLKVNIKVKEDYTLPLELYTSSTVENMKLGSGFVINNVPKIALLPRLETLVLDSVVFNENGGCVFQRLLSVCPVLETLLVDGFNLEGWKWSGTVSSQILKRLILLRKGEYRNSEPESGTISFDTPSLEYFEIYDVPRDGYEVVNFKSLVEAKLQLLEISKEEKTYVLTNLIKGIQNVESLSLDDVYTTRLFQAFSDEGTVFENLRHLSVATEPDMCWTALVRILERSSNLQTLAIEGTLHYTRRRVCQCLKGYSFLFSSPIETVEIMKFKGEPAEMVQIEYFLKMPNLEVLEVNFQEETPEKQFQIMKDLLMFPRASTKCQLRIKP